MAFTGGYHVGEYEGHAIEFLWNNWNKTLRLVIDGEEVARELCLFPSRVTLTGSLEHNGVRHNVVARSIPDRLIFNKDTIEVDGGALPKRHGTYKGQACFARMESGRGS
jgi:hypothetical protein